MAKKDKFNRESGFSFDIRDPDNPSVVQHLEQMIDIDGQLFAFSAVATFRILTAEAIDPKSHHPDTRHSYEKLYSVGTESFLVARTLIQFNDIIDLVFAEAAKQRYFLRRVWDCTKLLLECEQSAYKICEHTMNVISSCDEIIEKNKNEPTIPALPKVPNLEDHVSNYLMNGKHFLVETYRFLNDFFQIPFGERSEAHFEKHRQSIEEKLGKKHPICQLLNDDEKWIKVISECSNAIRHPAKGQKVEVENITLKPGNKFSSPGWKYDLSKKDLPIQDEFSDIIKDLDTSLKNMFGFFEEVLLLSIKEYIEKNSLMFELVKIKSDQVSKKCPVLYRITLKN